MNEVIIDGCNVAECKFLDEWEHCGICREMIDGHCLVVEDIECKTYSNCYYKQLQRAKAELEQYKKSKQASYEAMQAEWNDAVNKLRELKATDKIEFKQYYKAENERLKADIEELKEYNDSYDKDVRALLSENDKLKAENEKLKEKIDSCNDEFGCEEMVKIKAENEKLKNRNKLYKKIIKENIEKANNNFMILTACLQGNLSMNEVKEYAKLNAKNDELKRKLKSYKQALEDISEIAYTTDFDIVDIQEIVDEVLK